MISQTAAKVMVVGIAFSTFLMGFAMAWFLRPTTNEQQVCEKLFTELASLDSGYISDSEIELACEITLDGKVQPWMLDT